jgi:hypothetical protein
VAVATAPSSLADPGRRTVSTEVTPPHVIDNAHYSYQLNWSPFACGANTQLVGAAVHYEMPTG